MRPILSLVSPLAAAVLTVAAIRPAAAQQAVSPDHARPVVEYAAPASKAVSRALASYRFVVQRDAGLPAEVTVADSAGTLVASYRLPGDRAARPMVVTAFETDLVLQGESPSGVLTLHLYRANDPSARRVDGEWSLGSRHGTLHGRGTH
jgi:hypothetical protein